MKCFCFSAIPRKYVDANSGALKVAYKAAGAADWQLEVADPNSDASYSSIGVSPSGHVYTSYHDNNEATLRVAHKPPGETWASEVIDSSSDDVGTYTSLAIDSDGDVHVLYYDATNHRLKHAWCE